MWLRLIGLITLAIFQVCSGQTCLTTNDSPDKNAECKFPWKFNGKTLNGCTDETDPDGKFWCSTKVDDKLEHIGGQGNWGFCRQSCPPITPVTTPKPPTTPRSRPRPRPRPASRPSSGKPPPNGVTDSAAGNYHPNEEDGTCGQYLGTGFILGGEYTKRGELPYQAVLGYRNRRGKIKYNCGGTMINRRYVITAAHCQHARIPRLQIAEVVLGDWDLSSDPDCKFDADTDECVDGPAPASHKNAQRFEVTTADITVHEDWDLTKVVNNGNDIALIRLPRLAITIEEDFDQIVMPACLGWDNTIQVPDDIFIASGWGRTNNDVYDRGDIGSAGAHSARLKKLAVPLIPLDQCTKDYSIFKDLTEKQICAGGKKGEDSCSGDSGGPLVAAGPGDKKLNKEPKYLIGIVSFGTKKCGQGFPGVYTSIDYYLPWILANMKP